VVRALTKPLADLYACFTAFPILSGMATLARSTVSQQAALELIVIHTNISDTLHALKTAAQLAQDLSARIRLLVLEIVPYPLPLHHPDVSLPYTQRRFRTLAEDVAIETIVDIHLVRDPQKALDSILEPHSVIVMGAKRSWWPTANRRTAKRLERAGHQVIYAGHRGYAMPELAPR
jgi:hypothetical protein